MARPLAIQFGFGGAQQSCPMFRHSPSIGTLPRRIASPATIYKFVPPGSHPWIQFTKTSKFPNTPQSTPTILGGLWRESKLLEPKWQRATIINPMGNTRSQQVPRRRPQRSSQKTAKSGNPQGPREPGRQPRRPRAEPGNPENQGQGPTRETKGTAQTQKGEGEESPPRKGPLR